MKPFDAGGDEGVGGPASVDMGSAEDSGVVKGAAPPPAAFTAAFNAASPARGRGSGSASGTDPLRGLAPAPPDEPAATDGPRPSLWTRIKRAFQYGSQGRARRR